MARRFLSVLALVALAVPALLALRPVPMPGPGAVEAMHKQFFAALDRGDHAAAEGFLVAETNTKDAQANRWPWIRLPVENGVLESFDGLERARQGLRRFAGSATTKTSGPATTRVVRSQADCPGEVSYAVMEIERSVGADDARRTQRFLWTSLVRYVDGGWKIFHAHVSPIEGDAKR